MANASRLTQIDCPACGTRWNRNTMVLKQTHYECGCGYAIGIGRYGENKSS